MPDSSCQPLAATHAPPPSLPPFLPPLYPCRCRDSWQRLVAPFTSRQVWMYCVGNHEIELSGGKEGFDAYLTRWGPIAVVVVLVVVFLSSGGADARDGMPCHVVRVQAWLQGRPEAGC